MNAKYFLIALIATTACNSSDEENTDLEMHGCTVPKVEAPLTLKENEVIMEDKVVVLPVENEETSANTFSSDGKLKVDKKSGKIFLGKKEIKNNIDLSSTVVNFQLVNSGDQPEYLILTDQSFTGDREEVLNYTRAYHCKLVDTTLELIPMQAMVSEEIGKYDTCEVYSVCSIKNFWENDNELLSEEEDVTSHYLNYNPQEKTFTYKETNREFLEENNEETFYEAIGKFEYRNGVFYQVKEEVKKI